MARSLPLLAAVLGLLLTAPAAEAASRSAIFRDCEDDSRLSGTYTAKELRDARSNLPSDKDAYSDCRDVLSAALAASAARGSGGGQAGATGSGNSLEGGGATGTTGSTVLPPPAPLDVAAGAAPIQPTESEQRALRDARANPPRAGGRGQQTVPGIRAVAGEAATATIPTSLALVLVLLGVTVLLAAVPYVRRRVLRRRPA